MGTWLLIKLNKNSAGDWVVPDLSGVTVYERYQRCEKLLICVDPVDSLLYLDPTTLTSEQAETMKIDTFSIYKMSESGVTP